MPKKFSETSSDAVDKFFSAPEPEGQGAPPEMIPMDVVKQIVKGVIDEYQSVIGAKGDQGAVYEANGNYTKVERSRMTFSLKKEIRDLIEAESWRLKKSFTRFIEEDLVDAYKKANDIK